MSKNSMIKVVGFVGTLAAGAALVGSAVTGTGAYFTSSKDGNLAASKGHLTLNTTDPYLNFTDLMPGEDQTKNVDFNVDVTGKSDVWLVFDTNTEAYARFSGTKGNPLYADGGLGRFGHFKVAVNGGGALFESWNLQMAPAGTANCTDANGHGSNSPATSEGDTPSYCGVPAAMKLASNLSSREGRVLNMTFGITGRSRGQLPAAVANVPFKLVATQVGVRPDALNY